MDIKKIYKNFRAVKPRIPASVALEFARKASHHERGALVVKHTPSGTVSHIASEYMPAQGALFGATASDGVRWCEDTASAGLRFVGFADELGACDHRGWFTDDDGEMETLRGAVWQLPARKGCARFVGGYVDPCNEGAALIDLEIFEAEKGADSSDSNDSQTAREAARNGDNLAQRNAESEREYNRAWQASRDIEDKRAEIVAARREHTALIREARILPDRLARSVVKREAGRLSLEVAKLVSDIRELFEILPNGEFVE